MNKMLTTMIVSGLLTLGGCMNSKDKPTTGKITTPSGLAYEVITAPAKDAVQCKAGNNVTVHYTGWLNDGGKPGKKFDSSVDRGTPFQFVVGYGMVIAGWEESIMDMKVGEKRRVYIPSKLGYGARGAGSAIPPHADLIFDVEIISTK